LEKDGNEEEIQKAEDYIRAIRSFDLIVTEQGTISTITADTIIPTGDHPGDHPKHSVMTKTYSEWLSLRMTQFELWRNDTNRFKVRMYAVALLSEVNRGLTNGLLRQGQGLVTKWESAEKENRELRQKLGVMEGRLQKCNDEKIGLETENQKLRNENNSLPSFGSEVGSVDDGDIR
jgi:hypothetical protein